MPHVGPLKDEEGAKCPFANQQSTKEEKQERVTDKFDGDYLPGGMVTLATSNKDEVKLLQELGFHLVDISQPVTTTSGNDKEVKVGELAGLSLTLIIPGVSEPLHVVVTGTELVHELRQFTVERSESCYRTCMSLYHNGAKLEEFVEVASVEGISNGSVIKFEEEPYSLRDARIHICRTKEILTDNIDALCSGSEGMSFSFLPHITITNPEEDVKVRSRDATATPTKEAVQPPHYCLPTVSNSAPPLSAFYPHGYHTKPPDCLKELYYNKWNPPSSQRKLRGDLLYLTVHTLEGQEYGITSCYSGFYVNKCSGDQMFDPNPAKLAHHSHHLIGLLCQISPLFKKNFTLLQKQGSKAHTLEIFPSPFKVYPWVVPQREHCIDNYFTLEGVFGTKVTAEEQFLGQSQDWNEQFQSIKEMPTTTVAQKLAKEKAYYKAYMEYTSVAVKGAVAAVDGNIPAINCSEHVKQRMFIWNNIFLTFAFDSRDNYSDVGGDKAASKAASHDLKNLSILNSFDIEGIHCSATVVVDYRGYRVIAQTIIPGILSHNHEDTVAYGTIDNGKTISNNKRLTEKLKPVAKEFFLKEETLLDQSGKEVSLVTSMDVKGIIGQDNRCYVVDLFRMLPPDANWFNWPDDCCFGKSEGTSQAEEGAGDKTNDKDAMSADNTTGDTVPSVGDTVSEDTVTNISDKAVGQRTSVATIAGNVTADTPSDITADTLGIDRATTDTPSDMSSDTCRENQASIKVEGDMVSEVLEQEAVASSSEMKSNGAEPCDTVTNTKGKSDTANNTTSDTPCDKRTDTKGTNTHSEGNKTDNHEQPVSYSEDTLNNKGACDKHDMADEKRTDTIVNHTYISVKRSGDTECYTHSDKMADTGGEKDKGDDDKKMYMDDVGDVPQDKRMETEDNMSSDKRADIEGDTLRDERTETDTPSACDKVIDTEGYTLSNKTDMKGDTPSDKRTDVQDDAPSDKRTDTESDTPSDKRADTEGDTPSDKRADAQDDAPSSKRTDTESDIPSDKRTDTESDTPSDKRTDTESDTPSDKRTDIESDTSSDKKTDIVGDTPSDKRTDTESDKRVDTEGDTLSDKRADAQDDAPSSKRTDTESDTPRTDTESDKRSDTVGDKRTNTDGDTPSDKRTDTVGDTPSDKTEIKSDTPSDKGTDRENVKRSDTGDKKTDTEGDTPSDKRTDTKSDKRSGTEGDKRIDTEGDTPSDKRTDTVGDTPSDKTETESDTPSNKRTDTKGDTSSDKGTESNTTSSKAGTEGDVLTGNGTENVTHKEEAGNSIEESISNFKMIIELYRKRMKQNKSGQKLKFLRPELVKPFIHFRRLLYVQLLSSLMKGPDKHKNKEEAKAADHVTKKVVANEDDTAMTHPPNATNGSAEVEPRPSNNGDTATSEPHSSTLVNKSSAISDEEDNTVPNEGHSDLTSMGNGALNEDHSDLTSMINGVPNEGHSNLTSMVNGALNEVHSDLTSMINGVPNEGHSDLTSMMNGRCSPSEDTAKTTLPEQQSNVTPLEAATAEIIQNKDEYCGIIFNADLFTPGARHSKSEAELQKDFTILDDMGKFLLDSVIPKLVNDCLQLVVVPSDGEALTNLMHSRGINMRYLGLVAELSTCRKDLDHLHQLCITEMINRAAKKLLANELHQASLHNVATVIVYFLNCYLGLPGDGPAEATQEEPRKKSKKKRKPFGRTESLSLVLTKESLWSSLVQMVYDNFCYEVNFDSMEELCGTLHINKIVLLRRLCKTVGIQLIVREYDFTAQPTFSEGDIFNVLPIVKTAMIKPTDGGALFELASSQVNAGNLGNAQELTTQSLGVYSQVFGPLHSDVANCYRLMAKMHFMAGESVPAMCFQHKATMIFERVLGVDHPDTVAAYVNLALYCHHCEQTTVALRLMYRVRYLILLMFGQNTPEIATCDCNIALMLHSCKQYEQSLIYLEQVLHLNLKYHGEGSLQVALNHHLIARALTFTGDFRSALHHEKITYNIHKEKLGEEHQRTKESAECLEQLTEKAVKMQKQINEITGNFPSSSRAAAAGMDPPSQWGDVAVSTKKPSKSTRTKKKNRSKLNGEHVKGTTQ